jgi:regulator of protease activity HflC (stomatin/prohibitin superfamily)
LQRQTTLVKWGVILAFNALAVGVSWLASDRPVPDLARWPFPFLVRFFPGGLQPLGNVLSTLLGAIFNWSTVRYLLVANLAGIVPVLFAAGFIRRLYGFDTLGLALQFLIEAHLDPALYRLGPADLEAHDRRKAGRAAVIRNGKLTPAGQRPKNRSIARAGGPGQLIVPTEYAVQLERGGRLTRVAGPGMARLRRFEKAFKLVNLRQIVRSESVAALTQEGIPVKVEITVHCRIRASEPPSPEEPFPFDAGAVRELTINTLAGRSGLGPWTERPINLAGYLLNEVLARYRLDELFEPLDDLADPRLAIQDELRRTLNELVSEFGVEITELWLGQFDLPPEVGKQYLESRQADWQALDRARLADGRASAVRALDRARVQAQQEIVETLVAAFQAVQDAQPGGARRRLVALRLIDGLERLCRQTADAEGEDSYRLLALDRQLAQLRQAVQQRAASPGS